MKYFVWLDTLTGMQGQIWHSKHQSDKKVLFIKELSGDDLDLSLDELKKKFVMVRVKDEGQ